MPFRILVLLFLLLWELQAQITFPKLTGRVVDNAFLLTEPQRQTLEMRLEALEKANTTQMVVVTLDSLQGYDIADYGYQLGRHWGIGQKETNNGLLLIVAPNERKVRIEVGYGLEGTVTDARASLIISQEILPYFKRSDYAGGIMKGSESLLLLLQHGVLPIEHEADTSGKGIFGLEFLIDMLLFVFPVVLLFAHKNLKISLIIGIVSAILLLKIFSIIVSIIIGCIVALIAYYAGSWVDSSGSGGSYSSSSSYSGGFGGFSGGGGSFGGGGASGSW